jgi:hypothetical protein
VHPPRPRLLRWRLCRPRPLEVPSSRWRGLVALVAGQAGRLQRPDLPGQPPEGNRARARVPLAAARMHTGLHHGRSRPEPQQGWRSLAVQPGRELPIVQREAGRSRGPAHDPRPASGGPTSGREEAPAGVNDLPRLVLAVADSLARQSQTASAGVLRVAARRLAELADPAPGTCEGCGAPLIQPVRGRPRRWCGRGRCAALRKSARSPR